MIVLSHAFAATALAARCFGGQIRELQTLHAIDSTADVLLVEDAAQAQGARRGGNPGGSWGAAA